MVLGRFLWFFMGKNLQKLNWHGTDVLRFAPAGLPSAFPSRALLLPYQQPLTVPFLLIIASFCTTRSVTTAKSIVGGPFFQN